MLDFPALFGPNINVMGLIGIVCVGPKALKLPSLMEVSMALVYSVGGEVQRLGFLIILCQQLFDVRLAPFRGQLPGEGTVENGLEKHF